VSCAYGNDFESRLKSSVEIANDFLISLGGGWMAVWFLSPDWCCLKIKSLHCGQTLRWCSCAWWLCPLVMQLDNVSWATIWCRSTVQPVDTI